MMSLFERKTFSQGPEIEYNFPNFHVSMLLTTLPSRTIQFRRSMIFLLNLFVKILMLFSLTTEFVKKIVGRTVC